MQAIEICTADTALRHKGRQWEVAQFSLHGQEASCNCTALNILRKGPFQNYWWCYLETYSDKKLVCPVEILQSQNHFCRAKNSFVLFLARDCSLKEPKLL